MIKQHINHSISTPVSCCPFCDAQPYKYGTACIKCNTTTGSIHIPIRILENIAAFDLSEKPQGTEPDSSLLTEDEINEAIKSDYCNPNPEE